MAIVGIAFWDYGGDGVTPVFRLDPETGEGEWFPEGPADGFEPIAVYTEPPA